MYTYRIHASLGHSLVFKGLAGMFIWWMGIAFVLLLLLFAILYLLGCYLWICIVFAMGGGTISFLILIRLSKKYGETGWMKHSCRKYIPTKITGTYLQ